MKNNKGITLIALIITIIVMLILVAVTVSVVVNSDLIGTAQGAGENTKLKYEEEKTFGEAVTIKGQNYASVEDYENGIVAIDPNGAYILHVFGNKFRIGDTTTVGELDQATDLFNVTLIEFGPDMYESCINGVTLYGEWSLYPELNENGEMEEGCSWYMYTYDSTPAFHDGPNPGSSLRENVTLIYAFGTSVVTNSVSVPEDWTGEDNKSLFVQTYPEVFDEVAIYIEGRI